MVCTRKFYPDDLDFQRVTLGQDYHKQSYYKEHL